MSEPIPNVVTLGQAEYEALSPPVADTIYLVPFPSETTPDQVHHHLACLNKRSDAHS